MRGGKKGTLLCVDDEPSALRVRRMVLELMGYSVLTAGGGIEGIRVFRDQSIDAVLLDYSMPDLDGAAVAAAMRNLKPEVPIIMLSAYLALPQDVLAHVDAFVTKGDRTEYLLEQIETCLSHRPPSACR